MSDRLATLREMEPEKKRANAVLTPITISVQRSAFALRTMVSDGYPMATPVVWPMPIHFQTPG